MLTPLSSTRPKIGDPDIGQCVIERHGDDLYVKCADPRIWITREMVAELDTGPTHPQVTWVDDVLTINAVNRRVVYRVYRDELDYAPLLYPAEWPD